MPVRRTRRPAAVGAALALCAALAGCQRVGDRASIAQLQRDLEPLTTVLGGASLFDLPPIPIDVDRDGRIARIGGIRSDQIDLLWERLTGNPLVGRVRFFASDADGESYTRWFARAGIRQLTVASRRDGLYVLVNGQPLPFIGWDARSLDNLRVLLDRLAVDDEGEALLSTEQRDMVADLIPLLRTVPLQLDFNFPTAKGASRGARLPSPDAEAFIVELTEAERALPPQQTIDLDLDYERRDADRSWVPSWLGFSTVDLRTLLDPVGVEPPLLRLRTDLQQRLTRAGVKDVEVQLTNAGLYVLIDDQPLPHLGWNEAALANLAGVLSALYPEDEPRDRDAAIVDVIRATAPLYNDVSLALRLHFPGSTRAKPAPSIEIADPTPTATRTRRPRPSPTPLSAPSGRRIDVDATLTAAPPYATPTP